MLEFKVREWKERMTQYLLEQSRLREEREHAARKKEIAELNQREMENVQKYGRECERNRNHKFDSNRAEEYYGKEGERKQHLQKRHYNNQQDRTVNGRDERRNEGQQNEEGGIRRESEKKRRRQLVEEKGQWNELNSQQQLNLTHSKWERDKEEEERETVDRLQVNAKINDSNGKLGIHHQKQEKMNKEEPIEERKLKESEEIKGDQQKKKEIKQSELEEEEMEQKQFKQQNDLANQQNGLGTQQKIKQSKMMLNKEQQQECEVELRNNHMISVSIQMEEPHLSTAIISQSPIVKMATSPSQAEATQTPPSTMEYKFTTTNSQDAVLFNINFIVLNIAVSQENPKSLPPQSELSGEIAKSEKPERIVKIDEDEPISSDDYDDGASNELINNKPEKVIKIDDVDDDGPENGLISNKSISMVKSKSRNRSASDMSISSFSDSSASSYSNVHSKKSHPINNGASNELISNKSEEVIKIDDVDDDGAENGLISNKSLLSVVKSKSRRRIRIASDMSISSSSDSSSSSYSNVHLKKSHSITPKKETSTSDSSTYRSSSVSSSSSSSTYGGRRNRSRYRIRHAHLFSPPVWRKSKYVQK